jgi:hypothetical protein
MGWATERRTALTAGSKSGIAGVLREFEAAPATTNLSDGHLQGFSLVSPPAIPLQSMIGNRAVQRVIAAGERNTALQPGLLRTPIRALQQTFGNRALARLFLQTVPAPAADLRRKCACGGDSEEECAECRENRLAFQGGAAGRDAGSEAPPTVENQIQRDADTPDQTGQPLPAAAASPDQTPDGSEMVGLEPIKVEVESEGRSVEGGCDGLHLHGTTTPNFHRSSTVENQAVSRGNGCDCARGVPCLHVTGTLVTNYSVSVTIRMPSVPAGLTRCERAKVQDFLNHVLMPHELDHKAKFETYNGQTRHPLDITGCGRDGINSQIGALQDAENTPRQNAAQALSDSIDPFARTIDCSDCEKQSAAPGAGQAAGGETEIAENELAAGSPG